MRKFADSYTQAGYTAAEFGEPVSNNYFMLPLHRDAWERGWRAYYGWSYRHITKLIKQRLESKRLLRDKGKGLKRARAIRDW